jgi:UDP-2,3-diacylglucosamine pyrophosphatase LpxH
MRHTVVISDIHLCETERSEGLWMRYRQAAYSPDREIAIMLAELRDRVRGEPLSFVLDGDIFDFDAPRVVGQESVFHDLPRTAENAVATIGAILDDHPLFVDALAKLIIARHEVVFISGNHDVQLTLPEVRAVLRARLVDAASRIEGAPPRAALEARVLFRAWFHKTVDGVVIEHGNQYDLYCTYRYPMAPFGRDPHTIQPTMGSLAARNLTSRMGFFNPHVDSSFMLSAVGYVTHWAKHYLFSRRSLAFAWAGGAVRTLLELLRVREPGSRDRRRGNMAAAAQETGAPLRRVARHARLFARPAEDRLPLVMRELWIDRVALVGATLVTALVWLLVARGALAAGAALAPLFLVGYELAVPKATLDATWKVVQRTSRKVAAIHKASAVVFGHTHHPEGVWEGGVFYGNTGSWSAAFRDLECTQPLFEERPVVWLRSDARGHVTGGLVTWKPGRFTEQSPRPC